MNCHVVNKEGNALPDDAWHVSAYYENIRNKVMNLDTTLGACNQYKGSIPVRMCNTPMRVRHHLLCSSLVFKPFQLFRLMLGMVDATGTNGIHSKSEPRKDKYQKYSQNFRLCTYCEGRCSL
jgi:hypothetical protein